MREAVPGTGVAAVNPLPLVGRGSPGQSAAKDRLGEGFSRLRTDTTPPPAASQPPPPHKGEGESA